MFLKLALKSLINRKGSVILTIFAMAVSVFVLLAVEHIRTRAKENFENSVSGVDLIVGARTGSLNLLLYSVFHIGSPTNNIDWDSYQDISSIPEVKWTIPLSLGDSHKGFRVVGTTPDYFQYFNYGNKHKLEFSEGRPFKHVFDVVLGSSVAKTLNNSLGDNVVLAHGIANTSFSMHNDKPFKIVGILKPTGTPVDQTLLVSLNGIEAIHLNWQSGIKASENRQSIEQLEKLQPKTITAFMLGLNSRIASFHVQREINHYTKEPMLAILPGVALSELWQLMRILENTLLFIALLVFIAALLGLMAMLLFSIHFRQKEIQLLRAIGAPAGYLFLLIELEAILITLFSIIVGTGALTVCAFAAQNFITSFFGVNIGNLNFGNNLLSDNNLYFAAGILAASIVAASLPSLSAYSKAKTI